MSVEFNCRGCQQRLSTPAGSSGQHCRCPSCGTMLTVPAETHQVAVPQSVVGSLKIPCPRCHFILECAAALLGTKGQCRNCQHIFTITEHATSALADSSLEEPTLVFHCPRCRQLFAGQAEMEGRKGKCHACGEVFAISIEPGPAKAGQPAPNALSNSGSNATTGGRPSGSPVVAGLASRPAEVEKRPAAATVTPRVSAPAPARPTSQVIASGLQAAAPIQFACRHCAGTMEVPAAATGQSTNCPFCGTRLTIPAKSEAALGQSLSSTSADPQGNLHTAAAGRQQGPQLWTELGDMSGAAQANPYTSSTLVPHDATPSQWNARPRRKRLQGLTFANAFELTLDSLFPFCLIAPLLFGMAALAMYLIRVIFIAFARSTVNKLDLTDPDTLWMVGIGIQMCISAVGCFVFATVYCMTCNTALHAVRGKRISSRVVFDTGDAYGGMLGIFLGWTVFGWLLLFGIVFLARAMQSSGDPQQAVFLGRGIILALSLTYFTLTFLWGFVPYALLDGQSLSNAMGTSMSICLNHFWTVIAVILCGWVLYTLVGILSIGLGLIVLAGFSFYMNAAMYHLAED